MVIVLVWVARAFAVPRWSAWMTRDQGERRGIAAVQPHSPRPNHIQLLAVEQVMVLWYVCACVLYDSRRPNSDADKLTVDRVCLLLWMNGNGVLCCLYCCFCDALYRLWPNVLGSIVVFVWNERGDLNITCMLMVDSVYWIFLHLMLFVVCGECMCVCVCVV